MPEHVHLLPSEPQRDTLPDFGKLRYIQRNPLKRGLLIVQKSGSRAASGSTAPAVNVA
jgi:hypothetical protein